MTLYIPLPGNAAMASELAQLTGGELGALVVRRFPDEETYVRIETEVRGKHVDLVCTLARPDPQLTGLLFAAATRAGVVGSPKRLLKKPPALIG